MRWEGCSFTSLEIKNMKKLILYSFLLVLIIIGFGFKEVLAVEIKNPLTVETVTELIDKIINFVWYLAIVAAPIMFLIGGFTFLTSAGSPDKVKRGRDIMVYAAIGLAIVLLCKGLIELVKDVLGVKETVYFKNFLFFATIGLKKMNPFKRFKIKDF